jgi:hypothetical protein
LAPLLICRQDLLSIDVVTLIRHDGLAKIFKSSRAKKWQLFRGPQNRGNGKAKKNPLLAIYHRQQ